MFPTSSTTRSARHGERGQTLPVQIFAILALLSVSFFLLNWSYMVRLQIQAQNDADAAASLATVPQTTQFNQLSLALYAADVEEYRLRNVLNALTMNVRGSGGCNVAATTPGSNLIPADTVACDANYPGLRQAYFNSLNHYTNDVSLVETISDTTTTDQYNAAKNLINSDLHPKCQTSGDCNVTYSLTSFAPRGHLALVNADAVAYNLEGSDHGYAATPNQLLDPETADVTVCESYAPLLPSLFGFNAAKNLHIVARAAATPVSVTQEWFEPGVTTDPSTGQPYARSEHYGVYQVLDKTGWDYGSVNYSANTAVADPVQQLFSYSVTNKPGEFSVFTGWWNPMIVHPTVLGTAAQQNLQTALAQGGCQ